MRFGKHALQGCINGCETAIVSNLKNCARIRRFLKYSLRGIDAGREWLFTKDVFAGLDRGDRKRDVLSIRSRYVNRVRSLEHFERRSDGGCVVSAGEFFSGIWSHIVNGSDDDSF